MDKPRGYCVQPGCESWLNIIFYLRPFSYCLRRLGLAEFIALENNPEILGLHQGKARCLPFFAGMCVL